ncbi:hypothetical protein CRENBAI_009340 [Crenichthys baileyi]|uniref:acylphosphatase n=1 Tax=Crenichthys baileyi TaxID=28760 RepID=A0AAV9RML5_9TELE
MEQHSKHILRVWLRRKRREWLDGPSCGSDLFLTLEGLGTRSSPGPTVMCLQEGTTAELLLVQMSGEAVGTSAGGKSCTEPAFSSFPRSDMNVVEEDRTLLVPSSCRDLGAGSAVFQSPRLSRDGSTCRMSAGNNLVSVEFEISGHVQGSKSRCLPVLQYTEKEGLRLGLVGWVKNTSRGTVVGQVQGPADMVEEMKVWLSKEGSPTSRITKAKFTNQKAIDKVEFSGFKTRF